MLKKVRISLHTERHEVAGSLQDLPDIEENGLPDGYLSFPTAEEMHAGVADADADAGDNNDPLIMEMTTEGSLHDDGNRIEIRYAESKLSGMEGARTLVAFNRSDPQFLSMVRSGTVSTALSFETGKRYICSYHTPLMPFEVCIYTILVNNRFEETGRIDLEYIIEIRGAQSEHCRLSLELRDTCESPFPGVSAESAPDVSSEQH